MARIVSKLLAASAAVSLFVGALAPATAQAQWRPGHYGGPHHYYGGYGGHHYHHGYGGAVVGGALLGLGVGALLAAPYYAPRVYYPPPPVYYAPPPVYYPVPVPYYYGP